MSVECCVEVEEIGEEAAGGNLAGELIEVVVTVAGAEVDASFLFPYLNGEDGRGAVADPLVGGAQQLADNAAAFGRGVGAIVDGGEHHLVASARVDGVHVVDEGFHRLVNATDSKVHGVLEDALLALEPVEWA